MIFAVGLLQSGQPSTLDLAGILEIASGIFALTLFSISIIAWYLRRQWRILIVATAFLLFSLKTLIDFFPPVFVDADFIKIFLDFVVLALFFFAIVLRPRKDMEAQSSKTMQ